ncbi:MAG: hypothetical protein ABSG53_26090, partial [Thermoguttaceae bacterium]
MAIFGGEREFRVGGLLCVLLACLLLGCSREQDAAGKIKTLGGRVKTDADKTVVEVSLDGTDADDGDMQFVAQFPKLRGLHLAGTLLTDEGIERLMGLSELQALDVHNTAVSDAGIASLVKLSGLTKLGIGN